jgi:hypothetical protein
MPKSTKPRSTGKDTTVTAALSKDLIKSLDEWREKEGMTRGEAMRWIIDQFFKKRSATGLI